MKLKKYLYTLIVLCTMGAFTGCSDWLDYTPKDKETEDQTFSSKQGFYTAVNGVYNRLIDDVMYGKNLTYGMLDLMGKRYNVPDRLQYSVGSSSLNASVIAGYSYSDIDFSPIIESIWEEAYSTILNINVILDNAEQRRGTVLNEDDYNLIKGDLLALRAFLHFDLLRLFGPVYSRNPDQLCIVYNNSRTAQAYSQLSARSIIYDHLIPDLNAAEECLAEYDPVVTEGPLASTVEDEDNYARYRQLRLNYYAVLLLKARVYLWAGDTANALAEAQKLTDDPQVATWFPFVNSDELLGGQRPDRTFSTECLFGFYDSGRNTIYTSYFDGANLTATVLLQPRSGYVSTLFANGNQTNLGDYRYMSQWTANTNYFIKYREIELTDEEIEESSYPFYTYFMPLMHLSEAYYIAAECLRDTDPGKARDYMDTIMAARGRQPLDANITSDALLEEIKLEYLRETYGEGQAFYMFKRFFQNIGGAQNGQNTSTYAASDARYVLPLPESELINR